MSSDMFEIIEEDEVPYGDTYIAIDLAGFSTSNAGRKVSRLDEHAIAVVINHKGGWCVKDIIHGQWDTRETALRIVKAYRDYRPVKLGIERGMAKDAVLPYLNDEMARLGTFFNVEVLTHGNQRKLDRITWSLQGRAEKGRISLVRGAWNRQFLQQAVDFPSPLSHDDLIDALSYIDQISEPWFDGPDFVENFEMMDSYSGY
jgi:predicted phage terminase large subunit-like protein